VSFLFYFCNSSSWLHLLYSFVLFYCMSLFRSLSITIFLPSSGAAVFCAIIFVLPRYFLDLSCRQKTASTCHPVRSVNRFCLSFRFPRSSYLSRVHSSIFSHLTNNSHPSDSSFVYYLRLSIAHTFVSFFSPSSIISPFPFLSPMPFTFSLFHRSSFPPTVDHAHSFC
jgi:hypothetical protein